MCVLASSSCDKWRALTGSQCWSLRTVVCLINRKFIWRPRARNGQKKLTWEFFKQMSLDGEKARFTRTRLVRTDMCAERLVAADARKSRQICSYGDSQDVTRSIRRLSARRLFEHRTSITSTLSAYIEHDRVNICLKWNLAYGFHFFKKIVNIFHVNSQVTIKI